MKTKVLSGCILGGLLALLLLCACPVWAGAEDVGMLTISYPVEDTVYHIYSVGSIQNGKILLNQEFQGVDTSDYATAASVMADMIRKDGVGKELASTTVTGGQAVFTGLPMAIYLVLGDPGELEGTNYWPTPFLLSIPQQDTEGGLVWDVNVTGKMEMDMDISVVKRWLGDMVIYRPTSVTVRLMRDGKTYGDPVVLNYVNQWRHTWENLPPDNWYVSENSNSRYTTEITRVGNTFTITSIGKRIPQTGQLWWPVSVLALLGLVFLSIGLWCRRERNGNA